MIDNCRKYLSVLHGFIKMVSCPRQVILIGDTWLLASGPRAAPLVGGSLSGAGHASKFVARVRGLALVRSGPLLPRSARLTRALGAALGRS